MAILLLTLVALIFGWAVDRRSVLVVPALLAACYLAIQPLLGGLGHADNPLPFALLLTEAGLATGLISRRLGRPKTP